MKAQLRALYCLLVRLALFPLWRDRMDVPSKCTIVRAIGRAAYRLETTKESV
jgi:hypothetical protein